MDPWDNCAGPLSSGAHHVGRVGLMAQGRDTLRHRAMALSGAIRRVDAVVLVPRGYAPEPADLAQMEARPWVRSDHGGPRCWPLMFRHDVQTREIEE